MLPLGTLAPLFLFFAILAGQVSPSLGLSRKSSAALAGANGRGKFAFTDELNADVRMQCTWAARDVADAVRLSVKCEDPGARIRGGVTDLECEYSGKPGGCAGYRANSKTFWKQVARAFKKLQAKVCDDERALVRAGVCKSAPRDAHFKLDIHTSVASAQSGIRPTPPPPPPRATSSPAAPTNCTGSENARRRAEQQCSSSWASFCAFFFQILSDDC